MARYGYCRVSTVDQNLDAQRDALKRAKCTMIREEKASGTTTTGRPELMALLDFLRPGDELVVTRLDRLARSMLDFKNIEKDLTDRGVKLIFTEQPIMNSEGALGSLMVDVLAAFAAFETRIRSERQREGIERAKARGAYKGGKTRHDAKKIRRMISEGQSPSVTARALGCSRMTVYRAIGEKK